MSTDQGLWDATASDPIAAFKAATGRLSAQLMERTDNGRNPVVVTLTYPAQARLAEVSREARGWLDGSSEDDQMRYWIAKHPHDQMSAWIADYAHFVAETALNLAVLEGGMAALDRPLDAAEIDLAHQIGRFYAARGGRYVIDPAEVDRLAAIGLDPREHPDTRWSPVIDGGAK